MEGGLLSLKWNDHSHTFFDMLSTIRRKESYCDVTLISDGRYYKVHKLVLSTCSDFFDNLFSRTDCKHPVVIIANVSYKDLEALLNYMYLGEVNVLQTELANLMKAAEVLRIKGLAEPTKAPTKETKDNRRSTYSEVVDSSSKRKRLEDSGNPSAKRSSPLVVLDRPDSVESGRSRVACDPLATTDVVPTSSKGPSTREAHREPGISSQEDDWDQESNEKAVRPEVKVEDPILIKDEPGNSNWYSDPANDEGGDSLHYNEADTSLEYTAQSMDYSGSCLPWELSAANQPHPVEGHLPQGMPGASGMQGMGPGDDQIAYHPTFKTTQRGMKLHIDGYSYTQERSREFRGYWRCSERGCPGRCVLHGYEVIKARKHNHPPQPGGRTTSGISVRPNVDL